MEKVANVLVSLITAGGLGLTNYVIAESLNAFDENKENTDKAKGVSAILTIFDILLYLLLYEGLGYLIHNVFSMILAVIFTIAISLVVSLKLSKPLNDGFYKLVNKQRNKHNLISVQSGSPWNQIMLSDNRYQEAYLYSLDHKPLGFGWVQYISNDPKSNYSLGLVPFTDDEEEPQPSYEKLTSRIQSSEYKEKHQVNQFIDFKQGFIMITSIRLTNN